MVPEGPLRRALYVVAAGALFAACGGDHGTALATSDDGAAPDAGDAESGCCDDAGDGDSGPAEPPYPPGPYGGGIGDVMPDFTIHGYALSPQQRDSRLLPFREIHLGEVRNATSCTCLVVVANVAGSYCQFCGNEDVYLTSAVASDPSLCAFEVLLFNYDTLFPSGAPMPTGPGPATRSDLDSFTQQDHEDFPVGLSTTSAEQALSGKLIPGFPSNFVVTPKDMRIAGFIGGNDLTQAKHLCGAPSPGVETLAAGMSPRHIAVDGANVYWSDTKAGIVSVPLAGGSTTVLATPSTPPDAIAIDTTSVYWASDDGAATFAIGAVAKTGGAPVVLASGASAYPGIAVDGTNVYFTRADGVVGSVPVGGGATTTLFTGEAQPTSIAVDGATIYWVDSSTGEVASAPKGGGTRTPLIAPGALSSDAGPPPMAAGIVLGSGVAYVLATIGQGSAALVNVYAVPEQGGQPSLYNQGPLPHSDAMAVGSGSVYVAPTGAAEGIGTIVSLPKQGLEGLVTPGQYRVTSLATGGGYVYWAASGPDATANAGTVRRIKP